jgi:HEAT repeat protein
MAFDDLLRQLVQGGEDARIEAAEALADAGDRKAVGALVQALRDPSAGVRAAACESLGRLADARAVPPLVSFLRDPDEDVRGEAFSALLRIGQARASSLPDYRGEDPRSPSLALTQIVWPADLEAVKLLYESLNDSDPEVRMGCAYALGRMGVAGAFDAVHRLLHGDEDAEVRCAAAFALGDLALAGELRAAPALVAAWPRTIEDDELAVVVIRALAEVGSRDAVPVLLAAATHPDARVRQLAVMGLAHAPSGRVGEERGDRRSGAEAEAGATSALIARLDDPDVGVRRNAAFALGRRGDTAAINALIGAVPHSDAEVRSAVGEALKHLDKAAVQSAIMRAFSNQNHELRQAAAYLQGQLRQSAGLVDALADPEVEVRKTAALALGECGDRRLRSALERALTDAHWRVRVAAAEGLRRLADPAAARRTATPHFRPPPGGAKRRRRGPASTGNPRMNRPLYVAVEGPIGVGKTTLVRRLSDRLQARLVLEVVEENPFLARFYEDKERYAFQTQLFFLMSRFKQQQELTQGDLFTPSVLADYHLLKDRIFARLTLEG